MTYTHVVVNQAFFHLFANLCMQDGTFGKKGRNRPNSNILIQISYRKMDCESSNFNVDWSSSNPVLTDCPNQLLRGMSDIQTHVLQHCWSLNRHFSVGSCNTTCGCRLITWSLWLHMQSRPSFSPIESFNCSAKYHSRLCLFSFLDHSHLCLFSIDPVTPIMT